MKLPTRIVAPGPGRFAAKFTSALLVDGTQKIEASLIGAGLPIDSGPAGAPLATMRRQVEPPMKQPR